MTPIEPAFIAVAVFVSIGAFAMATPRIRRFLDERDRKEAIRLHASNWTHGQIAVAQGRDPRQIAEWLAQADRAGR